ncbi:MAG: HlyD family efflux transporter periplasmic adaptor subunit [Planctomycetes bacterium]|nr:HlyD family efflux transporter periplasmic adaptor subunit [Planctomycetota bacterium]
MSDESRRRIPSLGGGVALLFMLLSIAGVSWWQNQKKTDHVPTITALPDLDVVCLGRVDGLERTADLDTRMPGKVAEVFVSEGQHIDAKKPLLRLDDALLKLRVEEADAAVKAAEIEVDAANLELKLHPIRKAAQEAALAAATDRVAVGRRVLEEKKAAKSFGTITAAELLVAESEVRQLEQLEGIEKSRLEELKLADLTLKTRAADAKKLSATIALKQAQNALDDCLLLSPSAGTVLRIQASVGRTVAPGTLQPPVVFRPDGPLVVWAELEQEFLGRIKPGMKATIRDDARSDSPTWTGKVLRVGHVIARKRSLLLEPGEINDVRTVECVIAIDGDTSALLVGQKMRVRLGRGE